MGKRAAPAPQGPPYPPGRVARTAPRVVPPPVRSSASGSAPPRAGSSQRRSQVAAPAAKARPSQAEVIAPRGPAPPDVEPPEHLLPDSGDPSDEEASQDVAPSSPEEVELPTAQETVPRPLTFDQLQREFFRLRSIVRSTGLQVTQNRRTMNRHLEFEIDRVLTDNAQLRAENDNLRGLIASLSDRIDRIMEHVDLPPDDQLP